jgi:hypothetical protein
MDMDLRQLASDANQRLEDYAALTAETLAVALCPLFRRLPDGVFFEHAGSGIAVAFSAGGFRVTWPLGVPGESGWKGMGEAHFPLDASAVMVAGMARLLVHGWDEVAREPEPLVFDGNHIHFGTDPDADRDTNLEGSCDV